MGRSVGRLWGLDPSLAVPTSVTLGLGTVPRVLERLGRWWQICPASRVKLKLGSPEGLEHDQALVRAVNVALRERLQTTGQAVELQVDANGGWDLAQAQRMVNWLADAGVVLVEQPLPPWRTRRTTPRASPPSTWIAPFPSWPMRAAGPCPTSCAWPPMSMA